MTNLIEARALMAKTLMSELNSGLGLAVRRHVGPVPRQALQPVVSFASLDADVSNILIHTT